MVGDDRDDLILHCEKQKDADHFADIPRFLPHLESGLVTVDIERGIGARRAVCVEAAHYVERCDTMNVRR